jgi:hypothetical protein
MDLKIAKDNVFAHNDIKLYYKFEDLSRELPYDSAYEKKLKIIPKVIYPEFKKGKKSVDELANYYFIEKYLIEEYIEKIEKKSNDDKKTEDNNITTSEDTIIVKLASLENELIVLNKKLENIINVVTTYFEDIKNK